jgi:hypothetical protein
MYDAMLQSVGFRVFAGVTALSGIIFLCFVVTSLLRRRHGDDASAAEEVARARYGGDVLKAQAMGRLLAPQCAAFAITSLCVLVWAVAGPATRSGHAEFLLVFILVQSVFAVWAWLEYEIAWPGVLVRRGLRGTPGMRSVRKHRGRQSGQPHR